MRRAVVAMLMLGCAREPNPADLWPLPATTRSPGPKGTKGIYLVFERLGLPVGRIEAPSYQGLPPAAAIWLLEDVAPVRRLAASRLAAHVAAGGTLVALARPLSAVLRETGAVKHGVKWGSGQVKSSAGNLLGSVDWALLEGMGAPARVYATTERGDPVVASWRSGRGRVVLLGAPSLLRNQRLAPQGAVLLVRLALDLAPGPHLFDEFHAGYASAGSIWDLLRAAPYRFGLLQGAIALAVGLLALGVRRLPAEAPDAIRRRSTEEHVEAVARLWRRAGDAGLALQAILGAAADRARRRLGGAASATAFSTWVARARPERASHADDLWRRCQDLAQGRPTSAQACRAAAELVSLEREVLRA